MLGDFENESVFEIFGCLLNYWKLDGQSYDFLEYFVNVFFFDYMGSILYIRNRELQFFYLLNWSFDKIVIDSVGYGVE